MNCFTIGLDIAPEAECASCTCSEVQICCNDDIDQRAVLMSCPGRKLHFYCNDAALSFISARGYQLMHVDVFKETAILLL